MLFLYRFGVFRLRLTLFSGSLTGLLVYIYDALHTTGARYIVEDIDEYINARKKTA
ncbi:MAG: DUF3791 domain-containing protein [Christensenellaceae bacterium]